MNCDLIKKTLLNAKEPNIPCTSYALKHKLFCEWFVPSLDLVYYTGLHTETTEHVLNTVHVLKRNWVFIINLGT